MDISLYQELTGITVPEAQVTRVTAMISRSQAILEALLGYSLDPVVAAENQYDEIGKAKVECECDPDEDDLNPADPVEFAYRLFPYNSKDTFLAIDPALSINQVKLVRNNITLKTIDNYRAQYKNGLIKYLQQSNCWCFCEQECKNVQLAVDAVWFGADDYNFQQLPSDLLYVWAEMTTYYSNPNTNIKSETLGTHSYTKFKNEAPEMESHNIIIIKKYSGPNGSINKIPTI